MDGVCIRYTDLPGTSKLFADFVYQFSKVSSFYAYNPHDFGSFQASAEHLEYPLDRRTALVDALRKQNGDSPDLELLARPDTVAVVTGQQVGLFTGPAYTVYKALTAVKLARSLTEQGVPAVPVFWLATEDHDFAEVDHAWVFDGAHSPVAARHSGNVETGAPVGSIRLQGVPSLRETFQSLPFGEEIAALAAETYREGRTFGTAFQDLLSRVLGGHKPLFLDPLAPEIRAIAAPLLERAFEAAPELSRRLIERNRELQQAGYHAQVLFDQKSSLFFALEAGKRTSLKNGRPPSAEQLSPNALLRPVMQDYLLPTVAHVGGPAEVAYLAQSQALYEALGVHMPVEVPRAGFTLLDARSAKVLSRYGLALPDLAQGEEAVKERMARRFVPPELAARIRGAAAKVSTALDGLGGDLLAFDPSLGKAFHRSRSRIHYQISKIELKTAREAMRRDERAGEDGRRLSTLLYPRKHLQERFYSFLPFLAWHGTDLAERVYGSLKLDCHDHQLLTV